MARSDDPRREMVALLPRLRRFARALTGSREEGDDLVQAACERALARLDQWQPGTRLDSWMYRIAQTIWIDRLRAARTRGYEVDIDTAANVAGGDGRRAVEANLMLDAVRRAMGELPEDQRGVLALVSVEGLSYRQAAEVLGVPVGTVMSRLARARKHLHELVHGPSPYAQAKGGKQ